MDEQTTTTIEQELLCEMRFMRESEAARTERANKRTWIVAIIMGLLLVISNAIWLFTDVGYQETQTIEATQDGYGTNLVGGGDINYGADG